MQFQLRVLNADRYETVEVEALDEADARHLAARRKLVVVAVQEGSPQAVGKRRDSFELSMFSQELAELLDAGLEVVEAVDALAARETEGVRSRVYAVLLARLHEGLSFSAALEQAGTQFPPLYIGLIRSAEHTSGLHGALVRYMEYRGRFDALRAKIIGALIYPLVLVVVGGAVTLFLLGYVVPRFATVYRQTNHPLPWLSQLLLDWGQFFGNHRIEVLGGLAGFLMVGTMLLKRAWRMGLIETWLGRLPVLGPRYALFRLSQLYLSLGTLLMGGMPIVPAIELAKGVLVASQRERLAAVASRLQRGESLTAALHAQGFTTPVSLRLLRAGEGTGRIGEMLVRTARYHDGELARWLDRFSRMFEPVLMVGIGLTVGLIVVLLYLPIFDLAGSLQ